MIYLSPDQVKKDIIERDRIKNEKRERELFLFIKTITEKLGNKNYQNFDDRIVTYSEIQFSKIIGFDDFDKNYINNKLKEFLITGWRLIELVSQEEKFADVMIIFYFPDNQKIRNRYQIYSSNERIKRWPW